MGDLAAQSFDEIWHSKQAREIRKIVSECKQHCWMTGTAVPAMRRRPIEPVKWVITNKLRLHHGKSIAIE